MKEKWSYEVETLIHLFIFLRRGGVQIVQCNTATYRNIWREDYQRIGTRHHYYSRYLVGWSPTWVHNAIMEGLVQEDQQQQKKYLVLLPSLTSHTHIRIKSPPTPIIINASSLVLRVLILYTTPPVIGLFAVGRWWSKASPLELLLRDSIAS